MDKGIQKSKKTPEGNIFNQRENSENLCEDGKGKKAKPGRRQVKRYQKINDADQIKITIEHFFAGELNKWFRQIPDPRDKERITYSCEHLIWLAILMFSLRLRSRRQLYSERQTEAFHANLLSLSHTEEEFVASTDTMNYLIERLETDAVEEVKIKMVKKLIADKRLDGFRLYGRILVAVDGTQLFSFKKQHCPHCLKTKHESGAISYSHKMLEAKIVSDIGLSLSICSEPIENINDSYDKQDCELKAFERLAEKLKKHFPHTQICLLLDGLYACNEVFDLCRSNNWDFIIVFKEGSIPSLYADALKKRNLHRENSLTVYKNKSDFQQFSWSKNLLYKGNFLNVIFCDEHIFSNGEEKTTSWTWISNIDLNSKNIQNIVNKGGRQRWKIENQGFKDQKRQDFELEHLYGEAPTEPEKSTANLREKGKIR